MEHELSAVLAGVKTVAEGPVRSEAASVDRTTRSRGRASTRWRRRARRPDGSERGRRVRGALTALAEACEALGEACASSAMVFLMHSVTAATIAAGGGDAAEDVLRGMAAGELLGTLAFSERGTGAHFYAPELQAVRSNGGVRVSGRKSFVTSGGEADVYLLLVQGESEGSADAFLLRGDQPGLGFSGSWEGMGMAGNSSVGMELEDVELADAARIGAPGGGTDLIFRCSAYAARPGATCMLRACLSSR